MIYNVKTGAFEPNYDGLDSGQLPQDCYAVTEEQINLISASITGGGSVWVENGVIQCSGKSPSACHVFDTATKQFVLSETKQAESIKETQAKLIDAIDTKAAGIYATWTRFEVEHKARREAAEAFKNANYEGECSRYISDFAKHAGLDNQAATDLILEQSTTLDKLLAELANQRMRKYELKKDGLTVEQMQAIYDDIIKQMDNLVEAYNNG